MALAVENHPQRDLIIEWLQNGEDSAEVAAKLQPPLHRSTIWRYQRTQRDRIEAAARWPTGLVTALEQRGLLKPDCSVAEIAQEIATATEVQLAADPYRARIAKHQDTVDRSLVRAEAEGDGRTVAALVGVDLKGLELDARFTGRLEAAAGTTTIYVMTPQAAVTIGGSGPVVDVTPEK